MKNISILLLLLLFSCEVKENKERPKRKESAFKLDSNLDPVCKMNVQINLTDTILYKGKVYGFCSPVCKEKFIENPGKIDEEMK